MIYKVVCVVKEASLTCAPGSPGKHISMLGFTDRTRMANESIIIKIDDGDEFIVTAPPGSTSVVRVVKGACHHCGFEPYLRTSADDSKQNNLDSLPECT